MAKRNAGRVLGTVGLGLAAFCALNELSRCVLRMLPGQWVNWNDQAVLDRLADAPYRTILTVAVLSPAVEEVVFRGCIFGYLREYHRGAAYLFSCLMFALVHVWPYAAGALEWRHLLLLVQYMLAGAVLAWTFERSGSLYGSILLHGLINGLSVWRTMQ